MNFIRAFQRLVAVFAGCRGAPAAGVAETQLGGYYLAYSSVGRFRVGLELQLGGVHDLDFGHIHRDDDAAGWDGGLGGKLNDGVILVSNVSISLVILIRESHSSYLVPLLEPLLHMLGWFFQGTQQIVPTDALIR